MKLKIATIAHEDFYPALRRLAAIPFPTFETNRELARTLRQVRDALESYQKTRLALLAKYGTESEPGMFAIGVDKVKQCREDIASVEAEEIEIALSKKVVGNATLSGLDLNALADLVE